VWSCKPKKTATSTPKQGKTKLKNASTSMPKQVTLVVPIKNLGTMVETCVLSDRQPPSSPPPPPPHISFCTASRADLFLHGVVHTTSARSWWWLVERPWVDSKWEGAAVMVVVAGHHQGWTRVDKVSTWNLWLSA